MSGERERNEDIDEEMFLNGFEIADPMPETVSLVIPSPL